jgi:CRISPR/Cas system-associated exonuclease Cas4 (RecB family)
MDPVKQTYEHIQQMLKEEHDRYGPPPQRFRASEAGACPRQVYYRLAGYKPETPRTAFLELLTSMGELQHNVVRWRMKQAGVDLFDLSFNEETGEVEEENHRKVKVQHNGEEFVVAFRSDGGVNIDGVPHVLEIKTIDGFSFSAMNKVFQNGGWPALKEYLTSGEGKNRGDKYSKWFKQATISGLLSKERLDNAYLIIADRSMGQFGFAGENSGLAFKLEEEELNKCLSMFAYVAKALREGEPPMQEYLQNSKECGYCPYKNRCWGGS